jgi:NADPH-dependent 2,4-dienoyl-CoA reductase/sulfur reductase-like enzyme/nitrite reductase/ring-hydroxylating ferredoxin subunit
MRIRAVYPFRQEDAMGGQVELSGPDLTSGVPFEGIADGGMLLGHAHGEAVLLARRGDEVYAVGATCTHYSGPLAEGLLVRDEVHCPWHHACFSLRTGEAVAAPALNPIPCYDVERVGDRVRVGQKREVPHKELPTTVLPGSVVIVGAGAAGNAAAEMVRREGYPGKIILVGAEETVPVDRPNLSKDYLAGTAPEEWIPLRGKDFYDSQGIELKLGQAVTALDTKARKLTFADGSTLGYGALVLAMGAEVNKLPVPGADLPHVRYLRTLADSREIIARAEKAKRAVVIGASFIGLEVAASLRQRKLEVHVVGPEARPLERVLGSELADFVRALHEEHGVTFHLGRKPVTIDAQRVTLDDGATLDADLVVVGVGVHPRVELAEKAGLKIDRGVVVNEYLETSAPGVYAAGDLARWPDPRVGAIRVEHWVVAERQGQVAARNLLGKRERFRAVPFFWSQHYDVPIAYVGHAEKWDALEVAGSIRDKSCVVAYRAGGKIIAVASIYRDLESLKAEAALERDDQASLEKILAAARG